MRIIRAIFLASILVPCIGLVRLSAADLPFLHQLFTDHAVLQRDLALPVWGWTIPGGSVAVSVDGGAQKKATAGSDGRWEVKIGPFPAGGPHTLTVKGETQVVTLRDVLFGDVWICSGQSNMEFGITMALNAQADLSTADNPQIRLFSTPKIVSVTPRSDCPSAAWLACTKENLSTGGWGGFTAVGYYFGRELQKQLNVPIGLISCSWGGTVAETWVSPEGLAPITDFKDKLDQLAKNVERLKTFTAEDFRRQMQEWGDHNDPGIPAHWEEPGLDETDWKTMQLPTYWETAGYPHFDGFCWFRREVTVPESWAGKDAVLHLGPIDDGDDTYVNGTLVGRHMGCNDQRDYPVSAHLIKPGRNVIAVRVLDTGGNGGIYGNANAMRFECQGQENIPLAGAWRCHFSTEWNKCTPMPMDLNKLQDPNSGVSLLYNGMISELLPFAITGAIWYQGESNGDRGMQYRRLMPALITDWRAHFKVGDFPFYLVQLANFMGEDDSTTDPPWATLREAQAITAFTCPHCGMAVAIDIGAAADIHPKNKSEVGHRLALNALAQTYGRPIEYQGPVWKSLKVQGKQMRLSYEHLGGGLVMHDYAGTPATMLRGFAIAGADKHYVVAQAHIDGDTVVVSSSQVQDPVSVRYDWGNNPPGNLYNKANLPAVPFRSDSP